MKDPLLIIGVVGSIIAAICSFTPLLGIVLGFAGLGEYTSRLDYVALPALGIFIALTLIALVRQRYA